MAFLIHITWLIRVFNIKLFLTKKILYFAFNIVSSKLRPIIKPNILKFPFPDCKVLAEGLNLYSGGDVNQRANLHERTHLTMV